MSTTPRRLVAPERREEDTAESSLRPQRLPEFIGGPDKAGVKRAMEAMLQMSKLDIAALEAAYRGR